MESDSYLIQRQRGSDPGNAHLKHNALIDYIEKQNLRGLSTIGRILIRNEISSTKGFWRYCKNRIENTLDMTG